MPKDIIVTEDYKGDDRRKKCDDCVTGDFGTVKKLVFIILVSVVLAGIGNGTITVYGMARDGGQDTAIALVREDVDDLTESVEDLVDIIQDDKEDLKTYREEQRKRQEAEHKAFLEALGRIK